MLEEMDGLHVRCWSENLKGKGHLGELNIDGMMIFESILSKYGLDRIYLA
jgi:hypothetical protein